MYFLPLGPGGMNEIGKPDVHSKTRDQSRKSAPSENYDNYFSINQPRMLLWQSATLRSSEFQELQQCQAQFMFAGKCFVLLGTGDNCIFIYLYQSHLKRTKIMHKQCPD